MCLRVLDLGDQERASITRDEQRGLGHAGHGSEVYEDSLNVYKRAMMGSVG